MQTFIYILIGLIIGAILGAIIAWLIMRGKLNVANTILAERTAEGIEYQATLREREQALAELAEARQQLAVRAEVLSTQLAELQQHSRETLEAREMAAQQKLEAREQAAREAAEAQERRHSEAIKAQQERFDETIARVSAQMKDATNEMLTAIRREVGALFVQGRRYRKTGVVFFGLEKADAPKQLDLFDNSATSDATPSRSSLYKVVDALNARFGKGAVFSAAEGVGERAWRMKREKLSARPTTRWNELLVVK